MDRSPSLDETDVAELVGSRNLTEGRSYRRAGRVSQTRRTGGTLRARVQGNRSEPYRVEVTLSGDGVTSSFCSCPVGGGGACKHVAAALLEWIEHPSAFTPMEDVEAALERRSKPELIALIRLMLEREPDLERLVTLPLPGGTTSSPVETTEEYRRQARDILGRWGYGADYDPSRDPFDEGGDGEAADELRALLAIGDAFAVKGDRPSATAVYVGVATEVIGANRDGESGFGPPGVLREAVLRLGRLLDVPDLPERDRLALLRALFELYRLNGGETGVDDWYDDGHDTIADAILVRAAPAERLTVAGWVREAIGKRGFAPPEAYSDGAFGALLLDLELDTLDADARLAALRRAGRLADLVDTLLKLGRPDEAVAELVPVTDGSLPPYLDRLVAAGEGDLAGRFARERGASTEEVPLLDWLVRRAESGGDITAALGYARRVVDLRPSFESYTTVRRLARTSRSWDELRPELIRRIKGSAQRASLLVQIYLDEGEIDDAIETVRSTPADLGYGDTLAVRVAKAAEADRPREALALYRGRAERLIDARGRPNYVEAAQLLLRARALADRLDERDTFRAYLDRLRAANTRLYALRQELDAAGL